MKKDEKHIIARAVWSERVRQGISAKELAAKCGWSQRTYARRMANQEEMALRETWNLEKNLGLPKGFLSRL